MSRGLPVPRLHVGLIGDPVAHSLSPAIQQPALDALGVPADYVLWPTPAAALPARLAALRATDVLGANVTVPHKLAVMSLVDEVTPTARRVGAVNTIINRDGRLIGDNTDIHGFASALSDICQDVSDRSALILGAGGAARAVALALELLGVAQVAVANRSEARVRQLMQDLAPMALRSTPLRGATLRDALRRAGLVINATSLGWHPGEIPLAEDDVRELPSHAVVVDLTYRETDLLRIARERKLATLDGLSMLVYQGARALELWTGRRAPIALMMEAARRSRAART